MAQRRPKREEPSSGGFGGLVILFVVAALGAAIFITRPWNWGQQASRPATQPADGEQMTSCCLLPPDRHGHATGDAPPGMVWIPGGTFAMGDSRGDGFAWERPVHNVTVDGFYMDVYEVTNAQWQAFVDATGYVTTAEKTPDIRAIMKQLPPGSPPPPPENLQPGSLIFTRTQGEVPTDGHENLHRWWRYEHGTSWRHPEGPGSDIRGREYYPVVHVSWDDAVAYCNWAGKRLPTESEWEFAARGGMDRKPYTWGDARYDPKKPQANIWQGKFPYENTVEDGYETASPVGKFPPNNFGLYDISGNVWEWTSDWFSPTTYADLAASGKTAVNPQGPAQSLDPFGRPIAKRVIRGGSFLCHDSYCSSYRPSARMHGDPDSGTNHQGFRPVMTRAQWEALKARQPATAPTTAPTK